MLRNIYGIKTDEGKSSICADERRRKIAKSSHFTDDPEIVRIEKTKDGLIGWLTDKDPERTSFLFGERVVLARRLLQQMLTIS